MGRANATLDGVKTSDLGVIVINTRRGIQTDPFLPRQDIVEDDSFYSDKPLHYGTTKQPLEFEVTFFKEGEWTQQQKSQFARMIDPDHEDFVEYFTDQDPNKVYYVKYNDSIDFYNGGTEGGYFTVRFRCDSPYAYSPIYEDSHDFSVNAVNTFTFNNQGDKSCKPEIWITKVGTGDIKIINKSDGDRTFEITSIDNTETVYVDNEHGYIESSLEVADVYRYDNHNGVYLEIPIGTNTIEVQGQCHLELKYNFTIKG